MANDYNGFSIRIAPNEPKPLGSTCDQCQGHEVNASCDNCGMDYGIQKRAGFLGGLAGGVLGAIVGGPVGGVAGGYLGAKTEAAEDPGMTRTASKRKLILFKPVREDDDSHSCPICEESFGEGPQNICRACGYTTAECSDCGHDHVRASCTGCGDSGQIIKRGIGFMRSLGLGALINGVGKGVGATLEGVGTMIHGPNNSEQKEASRISVDDRLLRLADTLDEQGFTREADELTGILHEGNKDKRTLYRLASFGSDLDAKGLSTQANEVDTNLRILFSSDFIPAKVTGEFGP